MRQIDGHGNGKDTQGECEEFTGESLGPIKQKRFKQTLFGNVAKEFMTGVSKYSFHYK